MKSLFLIFFICAFISSCFGEGQTATSDKLGNLVVFGSAKRSFFTNVSQIIFSVNCQIPLSNEGDAAKADLSQYLQSRADECGNKIDGILTDMKLRGCEDSQYEMEGMKTGNIVKSSFVFTPLYDLPSRRPFPIHRPRHPRTSLHHQLPNTPFRPSQLSQPSQPSPLISSSTLNVPNSPFGSSRSSRAKPKSIGYFARQMVQICVPTAQAGLLMDQLVQNNATIYRVRSILPSSALAILRKNALKEAINHALEQADTILEDMGVKRTSYSIELSRVFDPHFTSLDVQGMAFLPRLFISKRDIEANVRLVTHYIPKEGEAKSKKEGEWKKDSTIKEGEWKKDAKVDTL